MDKPKTLDSFNFPPLREHRSERYLPSAFNDSLTQLQKINKVIEYLFKYSDLTEEMLLKWNEVYRWVMNEGLDEAIINRLDDLTKDGTLERIINENIFGELNNKINSFSGEMQTFKEEVQNNFTEYKDNVENDLGEFKDNFIKSVDSFKVDINESISQFILDTNEIVGSLSVELTSKINKVEKEQENLSVNINGEMNTTSVHSSKSPNPTIVIIDDDGRSEVYNELFPFMKSRNLPFTISIPTGRINQNNHITMNQFREMKNNDLVEYVNHTVNHVDLTSLSDEEIYNEIAGAEKFLRSEGIYTRHLVYPFGRYLHKIRDISRKCGINSATIVGSQVYRPDIHMLDSMYINRTTLETNIDTIKARIDLASNERGLFILNTHSQTIDYNKLQEIITYAINSGLTFKRFSVAYEDFSNIMELRRNEVLISGVNCVGQTHGIKDSEFFHPSTTEGKRINSYTLNTPITNYIESKLSITTINTSNANRWGLPSAGTLHTFRAHNDDYSYQIFYPIRNGQPLRRSWNGASNSWYSFVNL